MGIFDSQKSPLELAALRARNNPRGEPTGHFTGRCSSCGSRDLWDDQTAYGCNCCGATFLTGELRPAFIPDKHQ